MSVQLLHYRAWKGTFSDPVWAIWPIAHVALGTLVRRRLFWVLYGAGLLLFLMFFFGAYLLDWATTMLPQAPIKIGKLSTEPERIVPILRQGLRVLNGSQETFMYFFMYQGAMVMVALTLAGAVLVGNDFAHRSLGFFLSKPIKRWHYLAGKCLAVGVVVNLLTTLPALVLFAQHGLDDWEYFTNPSFFVQAGTGKGPASWPLLLGILGYGLVLTVFLSLMLVAAASWLRRTMPLIMVWTSLFMFMRLLATLLVELKYGDSWRLIDLWNNLCVVGSWCLGFESYTMGPPGQPTFLEASFVLLGVCSLCLIYLNLRTRGGDRAVAEAIVRGPWSAAVASDQVREVQALGPGRATDQGQRVLFFDRVSKWYGPVIGVNQVTLELRPGITGLVGHNGSGKSSLMRLAAGQTRPDLGRVLVGGHDAWTAEAKLHVGYCPELDTFYEEMSGRRFVETMGRLCGLSRRAARLRTGAILDLVGMSERADRPLAGYSKGMRQRIKLAQALLHDPRLLLLDEPLSGIDPIGRRESIALFKELARQGKCLLISSHELDELEKLTDHVAIMAAGRIAAVGTLTTIRDLLDDHPLSIRIRSDQNRNLAALLLACDEVVGLDRVEGDDTLIVRARNPRRFFRKLTDLVIDENIEIRHLEALDESTHDVLSYLLGGRR